jgi:hypothetical protein
MAITRERRLDLDSQWCLETRRYVERIAELVGGAADSGVGGAGSWADDCVLGPGRTMNKYDRSFRNLDTIYVLSFFFQIAGFLFGAVGFVAWKQEGYDWGLWLAVGSVVWILTWFPVW